MPFKVIIASQVPAHRLCQIIRACATPSSCHFSNIDVPMCQQLQVVVLYPMLDLQHCAVLFVPAFSTRAKIPEVPALAPHCCRYQPYHGSIVLASAPQIVSCQSTDVAVHCYIAFQLPTFGPCPLCASAHTVLCKRAVCAKSFASATILSPS